MVLWLNIYLLIGVALLSIIFVNSFTGIKPSYAKMLGIFSIFVQMYLLGYLMELNADRLADLIFWNNIQYLGIPFYPAVWLVISMLYTGRGKYIKGYKIAMVMLIPVVTFILHGTNKYHHLYYKQISMVNHGSYYGVYLEKGPWYFVQFTYVLVVFCLCSYYYYRQYKASVRYERTQYYLIFLAMLVPALSLLLNIFNYNQWGIDYTALALPLCTLFINLAMYRYSFLEAKQFAREKIFEDSQEGLLLINRFSRIIDFNPACRKFLYLFQVTELREEEMDVIFADAKELIEVIRYSKERVFRFQKEEEMVYLLVRASDILEKGNRIGTLIVFEDISERELLRRKLVKAANIDELSGLNNRRNWQKLGEEIFEGVKITKEDLSVFMMDVDHFKSINDSYGHYAGDKVIKELSNLIRHHFDPSVITGRWGGEEFVAVLPSTNIQQALVSAKELEMQLADLVITYEKEQIKVTISIGIAELNPSITSFDELITNADKALFQAKQKGRNQIILWKKKEKEM